MSAVELFCQELLRRAVGQICLSLGWTSTSEIAQNALVDVLSHYIDELAQKTQRYCEQGCRTSPSLDDLALAFNDVGVSLSDMEYFVSSIGTRLLSSNESNVVDLLYSSSHLPRRRLVATSSNLPTKFDAETEEGIEFDDPMTMKEHDVSMQSDAMSETSRDEEWGSPTKLLNNKSQNDVGGNGDDVVVAATGSDVSDGNDDFLPWDNPSVVNIQNRLPTVESNRKEKEEEEEEEEKVIPPPPPPPVSPEVDVVALKEPSVKKKAEKRVSKDDFKIPKLKFKFGSNKEDVVDAPTPPPPPPPPLPSLPPPPPPLPTTGFDEKTSSERKLKKKKKKMKVKEGEHAEKKIKKSKHKEKKGNSAAEASLVHTLPVRPSLAMSQLQEPAPKYSKMVLPPSAGVVSQTLPFATQVPIVSNVSQRQYICPICRLGEIQSTDWITCDKCGDQNDVWYHLSCVGIKTIPDDSFTWFCPSCRKSKRHSKI